MKITKTLYVKNAKEWRDWLEKNHDKADDIWLLLPHQGSKKPKIKYNDSVEEALCFGWIDTTVKNYDKETSVQRFTKRNEKSPYSQMNIVRLRWLAKEKKLKPWVLKKVKHLIDKKYVLPKEILSEIKKDKKAWENFQKFSDAYKEIRVGYIESQKPIPELYDKALKNFIKKTAAGKQFGYGGIDKYF